MWLIVLALILFISVVPVMVGARVVGAQRNGFWICFGALLISSIISWIAMRLFHGLWFLGFFASGLGYMIVLDTTYLRGLGIAVIQGLLVVALVFVLAITALGSMFHMKDMLHNLPISSTPGQSV